MNMRLDKYLADMNMGSRSDLKKQIRRGSVSVNGETVKDPAAQVEPSDCVTYGGRAVSYAVFEYYMMNKPAGVLTATEDRHQRTVLDLMGTEVRRDLFPVGRLDKDTEGLLLITNDGQLAHRLLSPGKHVAKQYAAEIDYPVTDEDIRRFAEGVVIGRDPDSGRDIVTLPAELRRCDGTGAGSSVLITIYEGKFHEIKRMFEAVGKQVLYLKRLSMGPLSLDPELAPGGFRPLTEAEITGLGASSVPQIPKNV
jgi:16S rRNA pseudouridine516 synthase